MNTAKQNQADTIAKLEAFIERQTRLLDHALTSDYEAGGRNTLASLEALVASLKVAK